MQSNSNRGPSHDILPNTLHKKYLSVQFYTGIIFNQNNAFGFQYHVTRKKKKRKTTETKTTFKSYLNATMMISNIKFAISITNGRNSRAVSNSLILRKLCIVRS